MNPEKIIHDTPTGVAVQNFLEVALDCYIATDGDNIPPWLVSCIGLIIIEAPGAVDSLLQNIDNEPPLNWWIYLELLRMINDISHGVLEKDLELPNRAQPPAKPAPPIPPAVEEPKQTEQSDDENEEDDEESLQAYVGGWKVDGVEFKTATAAAKAAGVSSSWLLQKMYRRNRCRLKGHIVVERLQKTEGYEEDLDSDQYFGGNKRPVWEPSTGKRWESITACAKELDVPIAEICRTAKRGGMLSNGMTILYADRQTPEQETVTYPAKTSAAEAHGVSKSTIDRRIKDGEPINGKILTQPKSGVGVIESLPRERESILEMCGKCGSDDPPNNFGECPKCGSSKREKISRGKILLESAGTT